MTEISFGSTYKIPLKQWSVNNTKKTQLKTMISSYGNYLIKSGKDPYALVSIADKKDMNFMRKLKKLGFFAYQMFEGENIKKEALEKYIQTAEII